MDIYCQQCGEPWDSHELGPDGDFNSKERKDFKTGVGCPSCAWGTNSKRIDEYNESIKEQDKLDPAGATAVLFDLLGDDIDGIASSLDDIDF
jgi:hypothetical protein